MKQPINSPTDLYYIHHGPIPSYLLYSMENSRVFNPTARIFLIGNNRNSALDRLDVTLIPFEELPQADHDAFLRSYIHTSSNPEPFERFCFSRWFYLNEAVKAVRSRFALHLDSDCMMFTDACTLPDRLLPERQQCYFGPGGAPQLALFTPEGIQSLTNLMKEVFNLQYYNDWVNSGHNLNFCDMAVLDYHAKLNPAMVHQRIRWPDAIIDQTMSLSEGFEVWSGKKTLKQVTWIEENGHLVPMLKEQNTGKLISSLALHYKGSRKRYMRPFNRLHDKWFRLKVRRLWLNMAKPINRFKM